MCRASEADKDPLDPLYSILVHHRTPRELGISIHGLFNRLDVDCSGCVSFDEVRGHAIFLAAVASACRGVGAE